MKRRTFVTDRELQLRTGPLRRLLLVLLALTGLDVFAGHDMRFERLEGDFGATYLDRAKTYVP